MDIHFNIKKFIRYALIPCLWSNFILVVAQTYPVQINLSVMPPYTSNLNDYINNPNKIVASITHAYFDYPDVELYLKGSITSEGGVVVKTKESYKPGSPIHLSRGSVFPLTLDIISELFDINQLDVVGIDLKDILSGAGLPEDNYQICLRAFDYQTNQPLSEDEPLGCSNYFSITNLEAPFISYPFCGDTVSLHPFQNFMVSWTTPAGAMGARYTFQMVEIPKGAEINPNDAFLSVGSSLFYEEMVPVNVLHITPEKVILNPGFTYAFRIKAVDPMGQYYFRNSGLSEVCHIVCAEDDGININSLTGSFSKNNEMIQAFEEQVELIPNTVISGKLLAKFPDSPHDPINAILNNLGNPPQVINFPGSGNTASGENQNLETYMKHTNNESKNNKGFSYSTVTEMTAKEGSSVQSNSMTLMPSVPVPKGNITEGLVSELKRQPFFYFDKTESVVHTRSLSNVRIRLVGRFAVNMPGGLQGVNFPVYRSPQLNEIAYLTDINGNNRSDANKIIDVVLDETTTNEQGNFTFDFRSDFFTGFSDITALGDPYIENDVHQINPLDKLQWGMDEITQFMDASEITQVTSEQYLGAGHQHAQGGQKVMKAEGNFLEGSYTGYVCLKIEVINDKFCSPDIDIFAMPGDVIDLPTQVSRLKTYNIKVVSLASNDKNQEASIGKAMDNVKVHIMRDKKDADEELDLIIDYEGQRLKTKTINNNGEFKDVAIATTGAEENAFVYIKNLVKHAYFSPQYFISISTRNPEDAEDEYEFTRYNYKSQFLALETNSLNKAKPQNGYVEYNHQYTIPELEMVYTLKPLQPEIKGRVMARTNIQNTSVENARVELFNQPIYNKTYSNLHLFLTGTYTGQIELEAWKNSNDVGIYRFENLKVDTNSYGQVDGPFRRVLISHPGYKSVLRPVPENKPWNLGLGILKDIKDIDLEPAEMLEGYVVDEEGNAVTAYVKTSHSPFYSTYYRNFLGKEYQFFSAPVRHYHNTIIIHPKSSQYFNRDTVVSILPNKPLKIVVYKKLHRPKILVKSSSGQPIPDAIVELGGQIPDTANSNGIARFKYASPGNQIILKIVPPETYAPIQKSLNIPPTPQDTLIIITLERARSIHGTITEKESNLPVENALIYTELSNTNGTVLYLEASSDHEGKYILTGIPNSIQSLEVFAVKKGNNPSYAGAKQNINFPVNVIASINNPYNFELKRLDDWNFSEIWGYPLVVNVIRPVKNNPEEYLLDGYFYNPPLINGFTLAQPDIKLGFKLLHVKKSSSGKPQPKEETISLDVNKIPLVINETFSGNACNYGNVASASGLGTVVLNPHQITKENDNAVVRGVVALELNTFNFAYDFYGKLYAGNKSLGYRTDIFSASLEQNTAQTTTSAVVQPQSGFQNSSSIATAMAPRFDIFSLTPFLQPVPVSNYKVFDFPASSVENGSYLHGSKIWIKTVLHTDIPSCITCPNLDLQIPAGNIVIGKDDINLVKTPNDTLSFMLEKWMVYSRDGWYFDKNDEAIVLLKSLIVTGKGISATVKNMKIKPTFLGEGEIDLSGGGLSLGGVAEIKLNGNLTPVFNYDPLGHYRISVTGSLNMNQPAGIVQQLPGMETGDRIELQSIGVLSNDTSILTINKTFRFFDIIDLEVDQIVSGNGYFDLVGSPDLKIPGLVPQQTSMRYYRDQSGNIIPKLQAVKGGITCPGHVYFAFDQLEEAHSVKNQEYTGYGTLYISDGPVKNENTISFRSQLIRKPGECNIEIFPVNEQGYRGSQLQEMRTGANKVLVSSGNIPVKNNQWGELVYSGLTTAIEGLDGVGKNKNVLTFTVHGDIDVESDNLRVTNINAGLGTLNLVYNFKNSSLTGTLNLNNVPVGPAFINQGVMVARFDNNGYYLAVNSENLIFGAAGQFKGGFLLGNTSKVEADHIQNIIKNFRVNLPPFTTNGLKGMYVIGEKVIANQSLDLIFTNVSAKSGLGIYTNTDFQANPTFLIGGYGYASIKGSRGYDVLGETVCEAGACIGSYYNVQGGCEKGNIVMDNCASITASGYANGLCTEPLDAIGVDVSELGFSISAKYGYNSSKGFYINLDLFGGCSSGNNSNNKNNCDSW